MGTAHYGTRDATHSFAIQRAPFVRILRAATMCASMFAIALPSWPQDDSQKSPDLTNESLENLMNMEVTSVSKKEQKLSQTASAVFVISKEDIQRSGALNIPDLLRMVPGMDVAQINANTWAISARGFNGRFSDELLVLVDGRSVYTPTTGGVFWDVVDVPLENIERIEVIRGPGASIWGANAVNGVVNIITKKAEDAQGLMVSLEGGASNQGIETVQYGGKAGKATDFRVSGKYLTEGHFSSLNSQDGGDGWELSRLGFRTDTALTSKDTLTLEGELYRGREGDPSLGVVSVTSPLVPQQAEVNLGGGYVQSIWNHTYSPSSGTSLQFSYDEYERNDALGETRGTTDIAFQNHFAWGESQKLIWGGEYRYSQSRTVGSLIESLNPPNQNTHLFSSFVQDEIALIPNHLFFTVGTKLERDPYVGFDVLPNGRLAWTPRARLTFWAAASDADHNPAEDDESIVANLGGFTGPNGPVALRLLGNPKLEGGKTVTYEAGYRMSVGERLSLDFATSYAVYYDQQTTEPGAPFFEPAPSPPHTVLPLIYNNLMHGESTGIETFANWKISSRWTLSPGYAFQVIHMHLEPTSQDTTSQSQAEGSSPVHSAQLRSHVALSRRLSWDASTFFTDRLRDPLIPSYTRLDTGLSWQWGKKSSLSIVGQNLLKDRHEEFVDFTGSAATTLIRRSAYLKWTSQF